MQQFHLFGNDVIFSSSRVLVSDNCKNNSTAAEISAATTHSIC